MRNPSIDFLRGLAAFGIVGCHLLLMSRTEAGWAVTNLCDMNVGIFAAVSGYLMAFGRWNGWGDYVKKRANRILPVYAVWTVVYLLFAAGFQIMEGGAVNARYGDPVFWVRVVFWGSAATHLWFLASLFYAQILMAGVFRMTSDLRRQECRRPMLLPHPCWWIGISLIVISLSIWCKNWYVTYPIRLLAFLILGRGLAAIGSDLVKRWRGVVLFAAIFGIVLHFVRMPWPTGFVKDWIAVAPILLAFVAWSDRFTGRLAVIASFLGATSMGVYLLHPIFTKGVGLVVRRIFAAPYGVMPVITDWCVSWLLALGVTLVLLRFSKTARFVR